MSDLIWSKFKKLKFRLLILIILKVKIQSTYFNGLIGL